MNEEPNRQPDDAAAPGPDTPPAQGDAQHADLYDVPPTPQREAVELPVEPVKPIHPDGFPDLPRRGQDAGGVAKRWLGILAFVAVTLIGAIWAVHRVVALHQAESKHARDTASDRPTGGRSFDTTAASSTAASAATGTAPISVVARSAASSASTPTPSSVHTGAPATSGGQAVVSHPVASWYDADLMVGAGDAGSAEAASGTVSSTGSNAPVTAGGSSVLLASLTPTQLRATQAGLIANRDLRLSAGAKIPCAGDTAFDSTLAGISTCTVTSNVYSDNGHVLLIERGSTVNTEFRSAPVQGQRRVFILSARIQTLNGVTVQIDSPAADALGRMGIDGEVDNHWGERLGAAFMLSLVQDSIGYLASRSASSNSTSNGTVVFENTEQTGNDMATRVLNSTINIPPTVTKNQGADFLIVLARDIDFGSVYQLEAK